MTILRLKRGFAAGLLLALAAGCGMNDPDVLFEKGVQAYKSGHHKSAARALERAVSLDPHHAAAQLWCGVALWKSNKDDEALPYFMAASQLDSANPVPLEYAALVHAERGEWLEVGKRLNEAFRRSPDSPRILNAMGVASAMRGNATASRAQLSQALRISPQYAPALYNAAVLSRDALHQQDEARRLFAKYLELAPDGDKADSARASLEALGLPAAPPATVPAPRSGKPASPRAQTHTRASALIQQADAAIKRQAYDEAAIRLQEAVEDDPDSPEALWALAALYDDKAGQPGRAMDAYKSFLRMFSDDSRAEMARTRLNALASRRPSQISPAAPPPHLLEGNELVFQKPEVRKPLEAQAALQRGAQYFARKDMERALFDFKRAVELDDTLPEAYFNLGLVYWCKRDFEHARQLFQNALAKRPQWPDARCMLARVYLQQRLDIKAIEHLNEILKTDPAYADAYYELGSYYRGTPARKKQVRGWFGQYLQLAPKGLYAQQATAWLAANP